MPLDKFLSRKNVHGANKPSALHGEKVSQREKVITVKTVDSTVRKEIEDMLWMIRNIRVYEASVQRILRRKRVGSREYRWIEYRVSIPKEIGVHGKVYVIPADDFDMLIDKLKKIRDMLLRTN